jgi:hypothetical protein
MATRTKAELQQNFVRGVLFLGGAFIVLFAGEFAVEFYRLGEPSLSEMSWAGVNNAKLVDALSPMARAYNNVLAMLIATIGLAIPLTATMHTPKLIDLFLKDRINRIVLTLMAFAAANVLFVIYLIGPEFAPMWAFRLAVYGALLGWAVLIPYYFYVIRFLDPSSIIVRLRSDALTFVEQAKDGELDIQKAQSEIQERLFQIGTIVIKSIDRADRSVAREGIWSFRLIIDGYFQHKQEMDQAWFDVDKADFPGMSSKAIDGIATRKKWLEMQVLYQLLLCYQHALVKAPDAVSSISNVNRGIASKAAKQGDTSVISMCIRYFNTFLREAINRGDAHAAFDIFYQYRQLAAGLAEHPKFILRIAEFIKTYALVADQHGLHFVSDLAGYDLGHVLEEACRAELDIAEQVLEVFLSLPGHESGDVRASRVRAKLIIAGYFAEEKMAESLERVKVELRKVAFAELEGASAHLQTIGKQQFWEITDRAVNIEWTEPTRRKYIRRVVKSLSPDLA